MGWEAPRTRLRKYFMSGNNHGLFPGLCDLTGAGGQNGVEMGSKWVHFH